jgi:hypothetical protein
MGKELHPRLASLTMQQLRPLFHVVWHWRPDLLLGIVLTFIVLLRIGAEVGTGIGSWNSLQEQKHSLCIVQCLGNRLPALI